MKRNWLLPLLFVTPWAMAQEDSREGVFEPGVQHVCVPAADGEGWDCGTAEAPPANYSPPVPESTSEPVAEPALAADDPPEHPETPEPPPFLADPMRNTPYAQIEEGSPEPEAPVETVGTNESPAPVADSAAEPAAVPVAATPARVVVEPEPASVAEATASDAPLGSAASFARLSATAFTLQLAYASDTADFPRLVAALGLDPATCYALRVRGSNGSAWLLVHGAFADVNTAKAAQARLPRVPDLLAQWPRRIGALQTESSQGL